MECNLRKLADKLTEMAEKYGDDAIVYVGKPDGSGLPNACIIGEGVDPGTLTNYCLFKIGSIASDPVDAAPTVLEENGFGEHRTVKAKRPRRRPTIKA